MLICSKSWGVMWSFNWSEVIGQNISFVLVVGTGNSVVFWNGEERTIAWETFNLLPGRGDLKVNSYETAELLPRGLFSCKSNSPSFRSTAFKHDDVCDGSCTPHAMKSMFLFLIATSQSFVHHTTDGFRQGFVSGVENEGASKDLFQKVGRSIVNLLKRLSWWSRTFRWTGANLILWKYSPCLTMRAKMHSKVNSA